ncbi:hypothetical protein ACJMK2_021321 [Sinanodonta woodiana]|uniref:Uncharacterized protein n=1 Tax=Sinanodonta woodiana TaxID=1069815 RepID=A0ABD3TGQ0_SINWO
MEQDIESQGHINKTEHSHIMPMERSLTQSINDCGLPPLPSPQVFTAGRTLCWANTQCDNHLEQPYKWCYTDYSNRWDYCCNGDCNFHGKTYLWCYAGLKHWQYCGNCLTYDVQGRKCLINMPCGVHKNELKAGDSFYWCYVDLNLNWDYCCAPHSRCGQGAESYDWCYVGTDITSDAWRYCVP